MDDFYKQKGFEEASLKHGNPDILQAFFDQIYHQLILDPDYKEQTNPKINQHNEEKANLQTKIDNLKTKIDDVRKDEENYRNEKKDFEEKARRYDLEEKKEKYNPAAYNTLSILNILLILVIIIIYSIFFMHLFSKPTTKILPPIDELLNLIANYWLAVFLVIIPLALAYTIEFYWRKKSKFKILIISGLIVLSLFLDYIIANATRTRIAQANELLGIATPSFWNDTNFWIVLLIGPLPVYLLSLLLNLKHKYSKEYIEERYNNPYADMVKQLRDKELNRKYKREELEKELEKYVEEYNKMTNFTEKILYIPKEELDTRIFNFYNGWIEWITNFYNQTFEKQYNTTKADLLTRCNQEYEKFKSESLSKFKVIYKMV